MNAHPLVGQCMVVGDNRPFVAALITLDAAALRARRKQGHGSDDDLHNEIQKAVDEANQAVSRAEAIREFVILPDEFTEASGELTPTLKLKRDVIAKRYSSEIDDMYR